MNTERKVFRIGAVTTLMIALALSSMVSFAATSSAVIDFEDGLSEGDIVSTLDVGLGITGDDQGYVLVNGVNPKLAGNQAMIFDATCDAQVAPDGSPPPDPTLCSGGDWDLFSPSFGNVLIISEDGDTSDPDDAVVTGALFVFNFTNWGTTGSVTVDSIDVIDIEGTEVGAKVKLYPGLQEIPIGNTGGDNQSKTVSIGFTGVESMEVLLNGSGAIDNIRISVEVPDGEGCTPGYWKNHEDSWAATGYAPGDLVGGTFTGAGAFPDLADDTLMEALNYPGGKGLEGGARILLRAAVAALLNASSPDVDYPLTAGEVIADVNAALASSDRETMLTLAESLDSDNNLGCPLD